MLKGIVSGVEKDIKRITMKGKNLFYATVEQGSFNVNTGEEIESATRVRSQYGDLITSGTYTINATGADDVVVYVYDNTSGTWNSSQSQIVWQSLPYTFTLSSSEYVRFGFRKTDNTRIVPSDVSNIMLNAGSTALPYEPYGYQEGWEVRDNQDRLIWGREDTFQFSDCITLKGYGVPVKRLEIDGNGLQSGTPSPSNILPFDGCGDAEDITGTASGTAPITFPSDGRPLPAWSISGNGQQTGTPTPDNPVMPEFVGVRTANLFDESTAVYGKYIDSSGIERTSTTGETNHSDYIPVHGNTSYTIAATKPSFNSITSAISWYDANKTFISRSSYAAPGAAGRFTWGAQSPNDASFAIINFQRYPLFEGENDMLNSGGTALPYEPFGWAEKITNAGQTVPVYLGEVPTVRRVRKLVLTGDESWQFFSDSIGSWQFYINDIQLGGVAQSSCVSNIAPYGVTALTRQRYDYGCYLVTAGNGVGFQMKGAKDTFTGITSWKSYIAAQYAAGTPVTVWYVLAEPETGIVNEPLAKIGDYADELHSEDAGVTIPTARGQNTLLIDTTVQPSAVSLTYLNGKTYHLSHTLSGESGSPVTTTIQLGQTQTVRHVRKLVLTGEETDWAKATTYVGCFYQLTSLSAVQMQVYCTHLPYITASDFEQGTITISADKRINLWFEQFDGNTTISDFKAYLAAQYAAGHPVTIWYVLAEPETGIVNEPLMKIGDYCDKLILDDPGIDLPAGTDVFTIDTDLFPSNAVIKVHARTPIFGFKINKSVDDRDLAVTYTHDAVTMTPAHMDFTNDRFDYGSWENVWFIHDARPCALNMDGTVAYYLDPNDATKKLDGTPSDIYYELLTEAPSDWSTQWKQYYTKSGDEYTLNDQSSAPTFAVGTYYKLTYNSSFTGNFMVEFPEVWFKRYEDASYNYVEICDHQIDGDWYAFAHTNQDTNYVRNIYLPMFKGKIVHDQVDRLRSVPGVIPGLNTNADQEKSAAGMNGMRWQMWDHSSIEMINDLLTLISKSIDSQRAFGYGDGGSYNPSDTVTSGVLQTGTLVKKGKFYGNPVDVRNRQVKVFGIEGYWNNRYERVQGLLLVNGVYNVRMTPPYNFTGSGYIALTNAIVPSSNGCLSRVQTSKYGSLPAAVVSSSGHYYRDWFRVNTSGVRVARHGGDCDSSENGGYRCIRVSDLGSSVGVGVGASPLYK